ncbi:dihydroxyacetone kinase family protein [Zhihengliuella sp.]|uniref:dihydroxyacetone kinase family protein n=1 Tax=Zhihengliuella sp. TaxID=1954483 RepID=UPI0028119AD5|nr:dihydroxyacetone kinase family protein [Zhihengliuella sp.]
MTRLTNDPKRFAADALRGFTLAHSDYVQGVHGGVVRSTESPRGQVALVLGGGSGHYPAFAGWVGPGFAHGAACGNVFASPAASQVYSVARAAESGGGVLLGFGNYAGDVLHFGQAAEMLRAEGIDVRVLTVSDDIASNSPEQHSDRRGIAGDLLVLKIAGAAAERGDDLDAVEAIGRRANERTRSLGVAFGGCTLPGASEPLFTVPDGTMALGLGIHGEPGISQQDLGTAEAVADLLVEGVLAEEPERGAGGYEGRAAVLLNGLGDTKYEELFVVYARVAERLDEAGITVVAPQVGEQVTSLDMAGLSLSVTFLDPELEACWTAPADTPAFRTGSMAPRERRADVVELGGAGPARADEIASGAPDSQRLAAMATSVLGAMASTAEASERFLGDLDALAGDGDHGQGMVLGTSAARSAAEEALARGAGIRTLLARAGEAWSENAGGTSGALWGAALVATGAALTDDGGASSAEIVAAVDAGVSAVLDRGGASVGDKTMVDALVPFVDRLKESHARGLPLSEAWRLGAAAATDAAAETARIAARRGRARTHGEQSLGHPDPGATSFALLMTAAAEKLTNPATTLAGAES